MLGFWGFLKEFGGKGFWASRFGFWEHEGCGLNEVAKGSGLRGFISWCPGFSRLERVVLCAQRHGAHGAAVKYCPVWCPSIFPRGDIGQCLAA